MSSKTQLHCHVCKSKVHIYLSDWEIDRPCSEHDNYEYVINMRAQVIVKWKCARVHASCSLEELQLRSWVLSSGSDRYLFGGSPPSLVPNKPYVPNKRFPRKSARRSARIRYANYARVITVFNSDLPEPSNYIHLIYENNRVNAIS